MGILTTIILLTIYYLVYSIENNRIDKVNLLSVFFVYWIIIVFCGSLQLYGLYTISESVYFLVIEGCTGFAFGYLIYNKNVYNNNLSRKSLIINKEYLKFKWTFYLLICIATIIIIKQILLILPIIIASGMSDARGELQLDDSLLLDGFWKILIGYFAKPFIKASMIVLIVNMFHYKVQLKYVFLIFCLILIYFLSEGGRAVIMDIFFVFLFLFYTNRNSLSSKNKRILKRTVITIGILPILATLERGSDIVKSIYMYYCGSLQYLSQALQRQSSNFEDHLYGMASIQGFVKPFTGILDIMGINKPQVVQDASDFILNAQHSVYEVAPNQNMNYFYTTFGYAYKDGGYIGNFLLHILYGIICKYVDIKAYIKSYSVRWMAIKATFFYCVLYSMSYYHFGIYIHTMTIIYILLITSNILSSKKIHIKKISV